MWSVGLCVIGALVTILITQWVHKWCNPKCNGVLPPGSMGFPLIGETLHLLIPSRSLDLHSFITKRNQRYGPLFRTSLAGRPVVVSTDAVFNHYIFLQEGKSVELWYLDTFSKLFNLEAESRINAVGSVHRYIRSLLLNHFGSESLKENLIPQIENLVDKSLLIWSRQLSIEVKHALSSMIIDFIAKLIFSYDSEKSPKKISGKLTYLLEGLMFFPFDIPGTTYHKCVKEKTEVLNMLKDKIQEKHNSPPETSRGDFLDQAMKDMDTEKFLTDDSIVLIGFAALFVSSELSTTQLSKAGKKIWIPHSHGMNTNL